MKRSLSLLFLSLSLFSLSVQAAPLINQNSGLCLEIENASMSNGANIIQNVCDNSSHQDWVEVEVAEGFWLQSIHSGQCLDVFWGLNNSGASFIQWPCHGGNNQIFTWLGDSLQVKHSSKCIDIAGASTQAAANVHQWDCNGSVSQKFRTSTTPPTTVSLFKDDFENGLAQWTQSNSAYSGIGIHTSNSTSSSLYLRNSANTVTSMDINADVLQATLSVWIRRGSDTFSESPDSGEDLTLSFLSDSGEWIILETFAGSGIDGESIYQVYQLPRAALHSGLQLRFALIDGSGSDYDYWHVDDVDIVASSDNYSCDSSVVLFQDGFESGLSQWSLSDSSSVGIGSHTAKTGNSSAYIRYRTSSITSMAIDASAASEITLSAWVRRGSDTFSEDPDTNEDLQIWYLNNNSVWVLLDTLPGHGTPGEIIPRSFDLSVDAVHSNLQIRFGLTNGSGQDYDYWHIDDVEVVSRNCDITASAHHFTVSHDTSALYCLAETITVTAFNEQSVVQGNYDGTVTLDTQTGMGTWTLISGEGSLTDDVHGDGLAVYRFTDDDDGTATFSLYYPSGDSSIDIDVYDNQVRDDDTEGNLQFSATGFTVTASPLSNPPVVPVNDPIATQVAGQPFTLSIAAYGNDPDNGECGIIETYTGNKALSMGTDYSNPATGTILASGGGTISFVSGQATIAAQYNDVGQISLTVTDNDGGITGQSNPFVVQPADFSVEVVGNPGTTSAGTGLVAAGEYFTVNVQALNALGNAVPNYGNEAVPESVTLTLDSLVFPSGGNTGVLGSPDAFTKISSTVFQNVSAHWSEVGSIRLAATVADADYLGTGNIIGSTSGTIGRFYPDHFSLGTNSVMDACTNYTYLSQPELSVSYTLVALNRSGTTTSNYDQGLGYPVSTLQYHAELADNATDLGSRFSTQVSSWSAGEYTLIDHQAVFNRASSLEAPLVSLLLGISLDDLDNRQFNTMTMNPETTGDCVTAGNCTAVELGSATFYFGRLLLNDAYGPETAVLPVTFRTEYWDGHQFLMNTADNCTLIDRNSIYFNNVAITNTSALTVDLSGGVTSGQFGILGGTNIGFLAGDAVLSFSAPGTAIGDDSLTMDVDLTNTDWLRFDWNQDDNHSNDTSLPTATVSFKTYRGHDRILYWRHR